MTREEKIKKIEEFCNQQNYKIGCRACVFNGKKYAICYEDNFTQVPEQDLDEILEVINKEQEPDNVNHPSHYTSGEIECIDAIKASMSAEAFRGFLKGNVIKYAWRYMDKGKPAEDLKKAEWYLKKLIKEVESDEK